MGSNEIEYPKEEKAEDNEEIEETKGLRREGNNDTKEEGLPSIMVIKPEGFRTLLSKGNSLDVGCIILKAKRDHI